MYPPPTPAQCRDLCSRPARRQAWSALRSPGSWSWGPCRGPQPWLGLWLPGAGAGCAWLLATGRAACCPGEGRKHLGVTFPGCWLPWRCATLGCWASPSHASERAAPQPTQPALLLLRPPRRDGRSSQSSRASAQLLTPVTVGCDGCVPWHLWLSSRLSLLYGRGCPRHPTVGQSPPQRPARGPRWSPARLCLPSMDVVIRLLRMGPCTGGVQGSCPVCLVQPRQASPPHSSQYRGAGWKRAASPPISAARGLWVTVAVTPSLEPGLGLFRARLPCPLGLGRLARQLIAKERGFRRQGGPALGAGL